MAYFKSEKQCIDELKEFLSIPSVSTNDNFKADVDLCAKYIYEKLNAIGFDLVKTYNYSKHPIVYAEKICDSELPTLLIYGHYDVQPAEPLEQWLSPPFEPQIRNGKIYARGASDDKSQVHLIMVALDKLLSNKELNCNLKIVFEGEEEIGSTGLYDFVANNKELLKADTLLVCDTSMPDLNCPTLINGLRGIVYTDVIVKGAPYDLHSGMNGGGVVNPFNDLCRVLGLMMDVDNNINLPGVNNKCVPMDFMETPAHLVSDLDNYAVGNYYEKTSLKTSFDIHGFFGGYNGPGAKTVITSEASVKCSFRLSSFHDPDFILENFSKFLEDNLHHSINFSIKLHAKCNAVEIPISSPEMKLAKECLEKHFLNTPRINRIGGTIPVVSLFKKELNLTPILMGFGLDEDRIHSPNESFSLYNYFKGIDVLVDFIGDYGMLELKKEQVIEEFTNIG